jgi:enoyl ACP reductase
MGILQGKNILVTGVLNDSSIAFHIARLAQEEGANVVLSSYGRVRRITERIANRLPQTAPVIELDVTNDEDLAALPERVGAYMPTLDGVVHSVAYAPEAALGGNFLNTTWPDVATAVQVSAFSLKSLTMAARPMFQGGASVVGLDFDATVAWPKYDWMGVAKAALESTTRYLARDLGPENVRVNLVAAGPLSTIAARSIPGFELLGNLWDQRSALTWDFNDPVPAAKAAVVLLSDWMPKTTGEIIHVDGGVHAIGG